MVAEKQNSRRRRAFAQLRNRIVGVIGKTDVDSEYLTGKHVFYDKKVYRAESAGNFRRKKRINRIYADETEDVFSAAEKITENFLGTEEAE